MSSDKKHSQLKSKLILKFLIYSFIISALPVIAIYTNSITYLTAVNDFLIETNNKLANMIKKDLSTNEGDRLVLSKVEGMSSSSAGQDGRKQKSDTSLEEIQFLFNHKTSTVGQAIQEIKLINAILIGFALLLIIFLAILIILRVRNRLRLFETGFDEIIKGNLSYRIKSNRNDTIGLLAKQFDNMAQYLQDRSIVEENIQYQNESNATNQYSEEVGITNVDLKEPVLEGSIASSSSVEQDVVIQRRTGRPRAGDVLEQEADKISENRDVQEHEENILFENDLEGNIPTEGGLEEDVTHKENLKEIVEHCSTPTEKMNPLLEKILTEQGDRLVLNKVKEASSSCKGCTDNREQEKEINQLLYSDFQQIPQLKGIKLSTKLSSTGNGGHFIFYPFTDDKFGFIIIEIEKQSSTTLFLSNYLLTLSKQLFQEQPTIEEFCNRLNQKIASLIQKLHLKITAFCGIIDMSTLILSFVNIGFKPPMYFKANGEGIQTIQSKGNHCLGENTYYTQDTHQLAKGDKVFFYNRNLSLEAKKGRYNIIIDYSTKKLVSEASFQNLSNKLSQIVQKGMVEETMILIELETTTPEQMEENSSHFEIGTQFFLSQEYGKALEAFERVVQVDPTYLKALSNIGLIFYKRQEYTKAQEIWKKVLSKEPNSIKIKNNLKILKQKIEAI